MARLKADAELEARAEAARKLIAKDPDVDRYDVLALVVWPTPAVIEIQAEKLAAEGCCRICGDLLPTCKPGQRQRYCGKHECMLEAHRRRNRAYSARRRAT